MSATNQFGPGGKPRCSWCGDIPEFIPYHDTEWGFPVGDDIRLFEKICLEGFQSGLSWRTILNKREAFRAAFAGFDFHRVATYTKNDVQRLSTIRRADRLIVIGHGRIKESGTHENLLRRQFFAPASGIHPGGTMTVSAPGQLHPGSGGDRSPGGWRTGSDS